MTKAERSARFIELDNSIETELNNPKNTRNTNYRNLRRRFYDEHANGNITTDELYMLIETLEQSR